MNESERKRLAAILGMLGSTHPGERSAAALQAEAFRRKHGLTWAELIAKSIQLPPVPPVYDPPPEPPPPPSSQPLRTKEPESCCSRVLAMVLATPTVAIMLTILYNIFFAG